MRATSEKSTRFPSALWVSVSFLRVASLVLLFSRFKDARIEVQQHSDEETLIPDLVWAIPAGSCRESHA
ncbi:MAG: hypothetical protein NVSMB43_27100 [Pseudarthrobacter sp.]